MRYFKLLLVILVGFLCNFSCQKGPNKKVPKRDYDEVENLMIKYEDFFSFDYPYYFIYIYSLNCLHCELIKNEVISYALSDKIETKFLEYYSEIPIISDASKTIGAQAYQDVGILGTPALLLIENKTLTLNISGMDIIKNVLKEYN